MRQILFGLVFLPVLSAATILPAYPQNEDFQQPDSGPAPSRVRAIEGTVSLQRQQEQGRTDATPNSPVFPGDQLQTYDGRAELEFPDGSVLWLDADTRVEILGIRDLGEEGGDNTVLRLHSGVLVMDYRGPDSGSGGETRIDTPESSVYLLGRGRFRVEANRGATTLVSARGVAELAGDAGSTLVRSGQKSWVSQGAAPESPEAVNTLRQDDFDRWCDERLAGYLSDDDGEDRQYVQEVPVPVQHYVTELDNYGDWQWIVNYGWVWRPTIYQVGWRPYTNGYWVWAPYGWTWVAAEPWGWVPYHYGRWSWVSAAGWVWIPGGVYSGAWVSWAVTPTYVGWCPLDFYNRPAYLQVNYSNVAVNSYGGGWNFLPLNRFSDRGAARLAVRPDRVPNLSGAITTRVLPRFAPDQIRTRPDLSRQILRESSRYQYRLEAPGQRLAVGRVSFRQADRREMTTQRVGVTRRGAAPNRAGSAPPAPPGAKDPRPRPKTLYPGRNPPSAQDPHATAGASRQLAPGRTPSEGTPPSRENRRISPAEGMDPGASSRPRSLNPRDGRPPQPRREPSAVTPQRDFREASRRVFDRILGGNPPPSTPSRQSAPPRVERQSPDKSRPPGGGNQPGQPTTRSKVDAPRPRPQPPRQHEPPPQKEEEKKDKP